MVNIFSGLAQTDTLSCFDEFSRIEIEELLVIGQQVQRFLSGIATGVRTIILEQDSLIEIIHVEY
jgi:hypothetical protein